MKNNIFTILFVSILLILLTACSTNLQKKTILKPSLPTPIITEGISKIEKSVAQIEKSSDVIEVKSEKIQNTTKEPDTKQIITDIKEEIILIKKSTPEIKEGLVQIEKSKISIVNIENNLKILEEQIVSKDKEIKKLEEKSNSFVTKYLQLFILAGTLIVAVCAYLSLIGNVKAFYGALGGGILILTSLGVTVLTSLTKLFVVLAGTGVVAVIGTLIYIGYKTWVEKRGIREIVTSVEEMKKELPWTINAKLFGTETEKGIVSAIQSPETKTLVKEVKAQIKK
jgi:hypothetical protein